MSRPERARLRHETLPGFVQQLPTRLLLALDLISRINGKPRFLIESDARGRPFMRLRYKSACGAWRRLHLGTLDHEHEAVLARIIETRWPSDKHETDKTIRTLIQERTASRKRVTALAAACGYRFRGWMLHRTGGKK